MGALKQGLRDALLYMPRHRERSARAQNLTLDTLLDEGRSLSPLPAGALDFILMGYRYHHAFTDFLRTFTPKPLKPRPLEDLLAVLFAALMTRDQTPVHALVSEGVEVARAAFGEHVTGIVNAFLRKAARELTALRARAEQDADWLLGPVLAARWAGEQPLRARLARQLRERPEAGVMAFDAQGHFASHAVTDFQGSSALQAMDPGSWLFLNWLVERVKAPAGLGAGEGIQALDACAAPGGKTIGLQTLWRKSGASVRLKAADADFRRLERLRANLERWQLTQTVSTVIAAWGEQGKNSELPELGPFDFILADLPCSGSGTLHSRPDLLLENLDARVRELASTQQAILTDLRARLAPGGQFAVSVCSVDPHEIAHVSRALGADPSFSSLAQTDAAVEGITGWLL